MQYENWLTRAQVARSLEISSEYVRVLTRNGRLAFINTQLGRLYDPASVEEARAHGVGQMRARSTTGVA
jgi:hypothetical protein